MAEQAANVPHIHERAPRLPGVLQERKNQLLAGGAVVIVAVVVLARPSTPPPAKPAATATAQPATAPTSPAAVQQYVAELQRETSALAQQQAHVDALKADAESRAAQQAPGVGAGRGGQLAGAYPLPATYYPQPSNTGATGAAGERKRESNIALTFRSGASRPESGASAVPGPLGGADAELRGLIADQRSALAASLAQPPAGVQSRAVGAREPVVEAAKAEAVPSPSGPEHFSAAKVPPEPTQSYVGKPYRIFEDTPIETVLTNRLNGTFTGPVDVMVTTPVYSHDRAHVLIPPGTRILGEATRVGQQGQQRLAVVFHRCIMPDGYSVNLDQFTGLNMVGEAGLKDKVDHHYGEVFGTSIALGLVSGFSLYRTSGALTAGGLDQYRQGVASSVGQSSTRVLDAGLNILPTVTIREGHRVRVVLRQDLEIPAYENHRLAGDL